MFDSRISNLAWIEINIPFEIVQEVNLKPWFLKSVLLSSGIESTIC